MRIDRTTTREERLAWNPKEAVALVRGTAPDEVSTVALAMFDQLDATKVPLDALEMAIVSWSRALDGLPPGPVPEPRLHKLDEELWLSAQTAPLLAPWLSALRSSVALAQDLDWAIRFLMQVHQSWRMTTAFRRPVPSV
jgi:hypothetical protein